MPKLTAGWPRRLGSPLYYPQRGAAGNTAGRPVALLSKEVCERRDGTIDVGCAMQGHEWNDAAKARAAAKASRPDHRHWLNCPLFSPQTCLRPHLWSILLGNVPRSAQQPARAPCQVAQRRLLAIQGVRQLCSWQVEQRARVCAQRQGEGGPSADQRVLHPRRTPRCSLLCASGRGPGSKPGSASVGVRRRGARG